MLAPAKPRGVPFDYVMQPCDVKLKYLGVPWFTVEAFRRVCPQAGQH